MKKFYLLLAYLLTHVAYVVAQENITDASIEAGDTLRLTQGTDYTLDGYVYVESGAVLTIEPGVVVKCKASPTTGDPSTALIVSRGGQIFAEGTATAPIIFTSDEDDLTSTDDLTPFDFQKWGGIVILGNGIVGEDGGTDFIEGIPEGDMRSQYGGNDNTDNSGVLKYVSLRHGGAVLEQDNEINGLTLGGVGSGTTIDYIEVFSSKDDGIEIFGGAVNITHAVVGYIGDDSYDFDESWDGSMQYIFSLQQDLDSEFGGDHAIEYDGSEAEDKTPKTTGRIYNGTFIGAGPGSANGESDGIILKSDGAAQIWNSIILSSGGYAVAVEATSLDRLAAGESAFANNIIFDYTDLVLNDNDTVLMALTAGNTENVDPMLGGISRIPDGGLDPRPSAGSPALSGAATDANAADFIDATSYRGAFSNSTNWALGWTAMDAHGFFGDLAEQESNVITDASIEAGETLTLTSDVEWEMDGYVYVEDGATLIIEPGTVIKARGTTTTGDPSTALIISRGGTIMAEGTVDAPIIFTSVEDDLSTTEDLTPFDFQKWGGIVILGNGIVGEDGGTDFIEGIPEGDMRSQYGGNDNTDNSGVLKYVSIRHGGAVLEQDNEINGLTLGGVGSGTTIDYIEVFSGKDDGIEIFGGAVNISHAVVGYIGDDSYDFDESWDGSMQFLFSLQQDLDSEFGGDHAIEYDGSEAEDKTPKTTGRIYNATFIGAGPGSANGESDGIILKSDGAAQIWNSIILSSGGYAVAVESTSLDRLSAGESAFANNIIFDYTDLVLNSEQVVLDALTAGNTENVDPMLGGISRLPDGGLDPRPTAGSPALTGAAVDANAAEFIQATGYRGAFSNTNNWALGWTAMDAYGFFGDLAEQESSVITDASIEAGETLTLTSDVMWEMDGYVYVEDGATLIIEPGTVIKARGTTTTGDPSTALIISRGGTILAEGTADAPIIFTTVEDDLSTTDDLTPFDFQKWGGIVILGHGIVGEDGGTDFIEGIPEGDIRSQYGGDNNTDNSGTLKYISIRHGGAVLEQDNEINGLTLGGVGSGTTIDYIEVFSGKDDGIEIFGGAVNITHALVAYIGDDSYDFDESWDGSMQYIFSLQQDLDAEFGGDHAIEYDGSESEDKTPKTVGRIYNGTFIGAGPGSANGESDGIVLKSDGAAQIWNSLILASGGYAVAVESTSLDRLAAGESAFANNIIFDYTDLVLNNDQVVLDALAAGNTENLDPMLGGVSRLPDGGLDPRPNAGSPALSGAAVDANAADFIEVTNYRGAFNNTDNWALGWSALDAYGFFGDLATVNVREVTENGMQMVTAPNPIYGGLAQLSFDLPESTELLVRMYDMTGRVVQERNLGFATAGANRILVNTSQLQAGTYVIALVTRQGVATQKVVVGPQ